MSRRSLPCWRKIVPLIMHGRRAAWKGGDGGNCDSLLVSDGDALSFLSIFLVLCGILLIGAGEDAFVIRESLISKNQSAFGYCLHGYEPSSSKGAAMEGVDVSYKTPFPAVFCFRSSVKIWWLYNCIFLRQHQFVKFSTSSRLPRCIRSISYLITPLPLPIST